MALADTARLIASLELQDKFSGPARKAEGSIGSLDKKMDSLGQAGRRMGSNLGGAISKLAKLGAITIGVGIGAAAAGIAVAVNAASDLNEEIDKSSVVFGKSADEVQRFAENAASIGLSSAEALGAAGNFGNMFKTIGFANEEAADMSTTMVELAADMASFNNEDPSDMLDRLRSGLSGEAEPLRRFGILISEATVNEFAYANGIAERGAKLTEAQKVTARYGVILRDASLQSGNFEDTSKSLANQQRILRANISNTAASIGTTFLPIAQKLVGAINEIFVEKRPQIKEFGREVGQALESVFTDANMQKGIDAVGGFIDKVASFEGSKLGDTIAQLQGLEGDKGGKLSTIAGSIQGIASQVAALPWQAIGDAARLLGTGSKALLDAFLGMPTWVQTAVLTGWGLNKLTGGALTGIVGELAKGLIKGVLGINAGVVHINATTVTGAGGVPGTGGGGLAGTATTVVGTAGILTTIASGISNLEILMGGGTPEEQQGAAINLAGGFPTLIGDAVADALIAAGFLPDPSKPQPVTDEAGTATLSEVDTALADVNTRLETANNSHVTNRQAVVAALVTERSELQRTRAAIVEKQQRVLTATLHTADRIRSGFNDNGGKLVRLHAGVDGVRSNINTGNARLAQIRDKRAVIETNTYVTVTATMSAAQVVSQAQAYAKTTSGGASVI